MTLATEPSELSQAEVCMRPLSSFEELLWLMDKRSPLHATLIAHIDGVTTVNSWKRALEQARQRHALWSSVIAVDEDGRPSFRAMQDPRVAFRVVKAEFAELWEEEVARELSFSIDAENGPLVRAVLLHTEASSMLVLSAHHSICDGMSLAFAIRDILKAVSGSKLEKLSLYPSQEDALGLPTHPGEGTIRTQHRPEQSPGPTVYRSNVSIVPKVRARSLSCSFTDTLRRRARKERTTVHAALIAAAGIAARLDAKYGSNCDLHLCSTINNRALLGAPEDCGVFFSACDFALAQGPTHELWNLARKVKHTIAPGQSVNGVKGLLGAVDAIVRADLDVYSAGEQGGRLFLFDIHVSNLGALPIQTSYGSLSLRQLWGPGVLVGFKGEQTLGASTVNGHLCLLHTSHNPLPGFLDQIESILSSGCTS